MRANCSAARTPLSARRRGLDLHVRADVIPCARHFVFIQVDLVGDIFICHDVCSLRRGLSGQEKRPLSMKDQYGIDLWDKSRKTSAVPPKLAQCAHSATCHHTPFLGNGGKARRTLPPHGVSSALCSPFGKVVSDALAPAGSSLGKTQTLAYFSASVVCCFELGASIRPNIIACQAGKCTFSAFHKRGTPHGGFISYLNTKRRKALENSGITHTLHSQNGGIY